MKKGHPLRIGGLPVVDGLKDAVIRITGHDISQAKTKDPTACAAALACKRAFKATDARVHLTRTYVRQQNKWVRYQTPGSIRSEIIAFDRGGKFYPGTYVLKAIPAGERFGVRKPTGPKSTVGKKRKVFHVTAAVRTGAPR